MSKLIGYQAEYKNIIFEFNQTNLPRYIVIDETKYQQLFLNIITNSIKYTFNGKVEVFVRIEKNMLVTEINDTGIGISEDTLKYLYNIFNNPQNKINKCSTGIGMGLSISKKLVLFMNGDINVTSKEGVGTKVIFKVKCNPIELQMLGFSAQGTQFSLENIPLLESKRVTDKCILIVDDTVFNLYALKSMLISLNIKNICEAHNGKQAIEIFHKKKNDIYMILMDINMPGMNGFETSIAINDMIYTCKLKPLPIVALSAQMDDNYLNQAAKAGIYKYMVKPIRIDALRKLIDECKKYPEK